MNHVKKALSEKVFQELCDGIVRQMPGANLEKVLGKVRVLKTTHDHWGYEICLLEQAGIWRGWQTDGWFDIVWYEEYPDGWPRPVALDGEPVSATWLKREGFTTGEES